MTLYLTYHPWERGTMAREQVLAMIGDAYRPWQSQGLLYRTYVGTEDAAEGDSLIEAPDEATLIRVFEDNRIPYLHVSEAWQVSAQDFGRTLAAGRGGSRVM